MPGTASAILNDCFWPQLTSSVTHDNAPINITADHCGSDQKSLKINPHESGAPCDRHQGWSLRCLAEIIKGKFSPARRARVVVEGELGAQGETRTRTSVRTRRPERRASTNSATWAGLNRVQLRFIAGGALYSNGSEPVNRPPKSHGAIWLAKA